MGKRTPKLNLHTSSSKQDAYLRELGLFLEQIGTFWSSRFRPIPYELAKV